MTWGPVDVLLAEGDYDLRDAMAEVLQKGGYTVATVSGSLEALEWLDRTAHLPSLILLDLMVPAVEAPQFRSAQEARSRLAQIPVVVLSASALQGTAAVEYVKKPVRAEALLAVAERHCSSRGA